MRTTSWFFSMLSAITALVVAAAALALILFRPAPLLATSNAAMLREITVVGHGTARAEPDTMIVQLGVQTQASTAKDALQENTTKMQELWARLKELGIPETAMATGNFSIWSNQEGPTPDTVSYRVDNQLTVTLKRVAESGALLQQVVDAGANSIGGITFTLALPAALEQQARDEAISNARLRAEAMAKASGATLGSLLRVNDQTSVAPSPVHVSTAAGAQSAGGVPVTPGLYTAAAYVQVTWELR